MVDVTLEYLRNALAVSKDASSQIEQLSFWQPEHCGQLFRLSCLNAPFIDAAVKLGYEPVDLTTGQVHDRLRDPEIASILDASTRASLGGQLLFEASVCPLSEDETLALAWARKLYTDSGLTKSSLATFTNRASATTTRVDDFKKTAIWAFLYVGAPAASRPWAALIQEDVRWCMACPAGDKSMRAALKTQWPRTIAWLDAFDVHQQMYPPREALKRTWEHPALSHDAQQDLAEQSYALPDLDL